MVRATNKIYIISFLIILVIAGFLRFWQIDKIPPGLYPDEAMNGINALQALETGNFKIFYPENNGREGLFVNIIALSIKAFGAQPWTIRIVSAIFGTLTVLGLYLLTKKMFGQKTALLASFFLATSFWHINFSRIGFRAIMVPFIMVFSFYFLLKALETKKLWHFIIAGIIFGLGFYTYIAFRFAPLILVVIGILLFLDYWRKNSPRRDAGHILRGKTGFPNWNWWWNKFYLKDQWLKVDIFLIAIILVALPIGIYFLQNPQDFFGRSAQVSIFNSPTPLRDFGLSIVKTLAMFNIRGDYNWRHNFSGQTELFWPVGILFIIGFFLSLYKIIKSGFSFNSYWLVISWFFIMLLPSVLTIEGLPHALRSIGVIPAAFMLAGLGFIWFIEKSGSLFTDFRKKNILNFILLFVFLFYLASSSFCQYFFFWAGNPNVTDAFSSDLVAISQALNSLSPEINKYVIVNLSGVLVDGVPIPSQTVKFITYKKSRVTYLLPEEIQATNFRPPAIIAPLHYTDEAYFQVAQKLPTLQKIYINNQVLFSYPLNK